MEDLEKSISELKQEFEETKRLIDENYKNMLNVIAEKESELQEIINDAKLGAGDCQLETNFGIFDCSVDMELNNLIKDIRSLCC